LGFNNIIQRNEKCCEVRIIWNEEEKCLIFGYIFTIIKLVGKVALMGVMKEESGKKS
jgi:hypothetical protein